MIKFVHLTDIHFSNRQSIINNKSFAPKKLLQLAIDKICRIRPEPDFILISGDLTNSGNLESYKLLKKNFEKFKQPVFLALGNHDNRKAFNKVFKNKISKEQLFYDQVIGNLNLITLDTSLPREVSGSLGTDQLNFLKNSLEKNKKLPSLIMMHHPPKFSENSPDWISLDLDSTKNLYKIIKDYKLVAIMCGHVHVNQSNFWNNIPVIISSGLYSTIDFSELNETLMIEGASFNICNIRENGIGVSLVPLAPKGKILKKIKTRVFKN